MQACAVEQDLGRHLRQLDAEDDFLRAKESLVERLMAPGKECDPTEAANFDEAIGCTMAELGATLGMEMAALAAAGCGTALIELMQRTSRTYWTARAEELAEAELNGDNAPQIDNGHIEPAGALLDLYRASTESLDQRPEFRRAVAQAFTVLRKARLA